METKLPEGGGIAPPNPNVAQQGPDLDIVRIFKILGLALPGVCFAAAIVVAFAVPAASSFCFGLGFSGYVGLISWAIVTNAAGYSATAAEVEISSYEGILETLGLAGKGAEEYVPFVERLRTFSIHRRVRQAAAAALQRIRK